MHPDAGKVLKQIKPEFHRVYKPHLKAGVYTGKYSDRAAVLGAAEKAGHTINEEVELEESVLGGHTVTPGAGMTNKLRDIHKKLNKTGYKIHGSLDHLDPSYTGGARSFTYKKDGHPDISVEKRGFERHVEVSMKKDKPSNLPGRPMNESVESIAEATTVVGKATKTGADKKGQELGAVSASVEGVKTEHEHEGKKYTVHSGVDRDGDVHHSVIHDGKQVHNHLVTQDGTYGDKPSPLHKKLIDDHVTSAKKHLDKMAGHIFSDEDDEDDMRESYENLGEAELSAAEVAKKEKLVKSMKKGMAGFKERYGKRWKDVMYATATARAKKNK
jgi:hypothetical protein